MNVRRWIRRSASYRSGRSLRTMLLVTAISVALVLAALTMSSFMIASSWHDMVEREAEASLADQRIASDIIDLTYEQQLDAYRYLQRPDSVHLVAFHALGDAVYRELQGYLFLSLSMEARNQVEKIKEAHQAFEVAAERMFASVQEGHDGASQRLPDLDAHVSRLGEAVRGFLDARALQRDVAHLRSQEIARRVRVALIAFAIALLVLGASLARVVRGTVLRPLDALAAAAKRLGDGDTTARVPRLPYREFNVVRVAFNQMADRVRIARDTTSAQNTNLRETLEHLHATQEELVQHEKLSAMGQMLAGLAHELNNPLAGILGMAECLRLDLSESPHADARAMSEALAVPLEREALRANALVRSLLTFAREPSVLLGGVRLAEAVGTAAALSTHEFAKANKSLHVDIIPSLVVVADSQKLQQAVLALIGNALDAIVESGGTRVDIRATTEGGQLVRLDISDDGPGFADVTAAFRPFYTTKASGKGTGLGLMLVQRFVNEFGGSVTAQNLSGGGARISLRLRRAPADVVIPALRATPVVAAAAVAAPVGERRVLVVDDEPSIRDMMRRLLKRSGLDAVVAASGAEARDIMLAQHIDLVFSDLRMPGAMDGYALLAWMERERPALAASALFATGDLTDDGLVSLRVPRERTLSKPFTGAEVVSRIRAALALSAVFPETTA